MQIASLQTPAAPYSVGALVLDYCPTQNFQGEPDRSTAEDLTFISSLSTVITAKRFCQFIFGTLKPLEPPPSDENYPFLLQFCHDPHTPPRVLRPTLIPQTPVHFADRVQCLGTAEKTDRSVFDPANLFATLRGHLNVLKSYQPHNAVQLKNMLDAYYNLENFYESQLKKDKEFIKKEYDDFWAITQSMYSLSTYVPFVSRFAPAVKSDTLDYEHSWSVARRVYALVGRFERYEVRAFADVDKASSLGGFTHFSIFEETAQKEELLSTYHSCPGFHVEIGRYQTETHHIYSEESPTNKPICDDKRILKFSPKWHTHPLVNQKIAQIMLEVWMHTERIYSVHFSRPNALTHATNFQTLKKEISTHPILHNSEGVLGGIIPEYWSIAPKLLEYPEAQNKTVFFSDEKH